MKEIRGPLWWKKFLVRIGLAEMALLCERCGTFVEPSNIKAHDDYFHPEGDYGYFQAEKETK